MQGLSLPDGYDLRMFDELDGTNAQALRMIVLMALSSSHGSRVQDAAPATHGFLHLVIFTPQFVSN